jgi:hypothetical protein
MINRSLIVLALLVAVIGAVPRAPGAGGTALAQQSAQTGTSEQEAPGRADVLAQQAGSQVRDFASYLDGHLAKVAQVPLVAWSAFTVLLVAGMLVMFFGWGFVRSLLVPSAPALGLATGGAMAFCLVEAFCADQPDWFRWALLGAGIVLGAGLYLVAALKAKPVAAFLVVLSPFLVLSSLLFPFNATIGLLVFCAGFVAGFAAMIEVRSMSIIATCVLGGSFVLTAWGLLSHLLGGEGFMRTFFVWLVENPLMLVVALAALVFIGSSFQFATAPRGGLED